MAVTDLLDSWDIKPKIVFGHSSGEIAAAYAAGYISYSQAIISSYLRGFSVSMFQGKGAMVTTNLSRDEAKKVIVELGLCNTVSVARINSPTSSTLSEDIEAVDKLLAALQDRGIFARKLKTDNKACHSHHMKAVGPVYEELLRPLWRDSKMDVKGPFENQVQEHSGPRMISSVTKAEVTHRDACNPSCWSNNLESPVEFEEAVNL